MANAIIGALRVVLSAETAEFNKGLTKAEKELTRFGQNMGKIGAGIAAAGAGLTAAFTLPMIGIGAASIRAAKESRDALAQVEASLTSMGNASGRTLEQLKAQADDLMKSSLFDDDDILRKVTANLLTFGKVSGEVFDRAQVAVVDLATKMGMDLQSATILVGKALNDPVKGLQAMGRAGIQFSDSQKALIKSLVKTGQTAQAQKIILAELERQYGGSAKAAQAADTVNAFQDSLNTLSETIGERLLPLMKPAVDALTRLANGFANLSPAAQNSALGVAGFAAVMGPALMGVGALTQAVSQCGPILKALSDYLKGVAAASTVMSLANLRLTFTTTALTAAFAGQNTAMALLAATGRTLGVVMTGVGRTLLALVGGPIGLAVAGIAALAGGAFYLNAQYTASAMAARANQRAHERLDPIIRSVKDAMDKAASSAGGARNAYLETARAAFYLGEQEIASARKSLAAARARVEASRQTEAELMKRGVGGMPGYNTGLAELRAQQAEADLKAAEDRLIEAGLGRRRGSRGRGTSFSLIDPEEAMREAAALGQVTGAVTELGNASEKVGGQTETAAEKVAKLRDAYGQLVDRYMTGEQREIAQRAADYQLLADAFAKGAINANQLVNALRMMREERERANFDRQVVTVDQNVDLQDNPLGDWTTYRGKVMTKEQQEDLRRQTEDAFRGGLEALRYGGAKGVMEYLANSFADRLLDKLSKQLADIFDRLMSQMGNGQGGGIFAGLGSVFSGVFGGPSTSALNNIPKFATGGSGIVAGSGAIDSKLLTMRVSPGELVSVSRANDNQRATNVFDLRGAVVTQDLLDQMNQIAAQGDAQVLGVVAKARRSEQQASRYRVGRGAA